MNNSLTFEKFRTCFGELVSKDYVKKNLALYNNNIYQ